MNKLLIGITGGIGSGKSMISRIIISLGFPVYDADNEAEGILETDETVIAAVKNLIGTKSYLQNGLPDKAYIASVVFTSPEKLNALNSIVHPAVHNHFHSWVGMQKDSPLLFKEAAIMFESGSYKSMNHVIAVTAPEKLRISRVMARDGKTADQVKQIISKQLSESELTERSNFVIVNDETQLVVPQVLEIIQKLKSGIQ